MATYAAPPYVEPEVETSYTAIFALIIAIVAIIILIVVIFFFSEDQAVIRDAVGQWTVESGQTTAAATFTGNPNSIYQVPSGVSVAQTLLVSPYSNISTFVTGTTTTVFRIDNTQGASVITVLVGPSPGTPPTAGGQTNPGSVPIGAVYEYEWISVSTFKLIGWSVRT